MSLIKPIKHLKIGYRFKKSGIQIHAGAPIKKMITGKQDWIPL
jgi:hypothetical protein